MARSHSNPNPGGGPAGLARTPAAALAGVDFTSRPTPRKPITVALGRLRGDVVVLDRLDAIPTSTGFAAWLERPAPRIAAFDLPFGLPRELVDDARLAGRLAAPDAPLRVALARRDPVDLRGVLCRAAGRARSSPTGRADAPAGSSSPMKWVNPPVAYMLHAGVPLLHRRGLHLPGLHRAT